MRCADAAVAFAVAEIKDEADQQPYDQSQPVGPSKAKDHGAAGDDAEDSNERRGGDAKATFQLGTAHTHDPNACTDETEREQGSNAGHFARNIRRNEGRERAGEDKEQHI